MTDARKLVEELQRIADDYTIGDVRAALQSALRASPPYVVLPEGWKAVPVEPTLAMRDAARMLDSFPDDENDSSRVDMLRNHAAEIYRAMLAAAPGIDISGGVPK